MYSVPWAEAVEKSRFTIDLRIGPILDLARVLTASINGDRENGKMQSNRVLPAKPIRLQRERPSCLKDCIYCHVRRHAEPFSLVANSSTNSIERVKCIFVHVMKTKGIIYLTVLTYFQMMNMRANRIPHPRRICRGRPVLSLFQPMYARGSASDVPYFVYTRRSVYDEVGILL